jgi:hypothetical protein
MRVKMQNGQRDKIPYLLSWTITIVRHRPPLIVLAAYGRSVKDAATPGPRAAV